MNVVLLRKPVRVMLSPCSIQPVHFELSAFLDIVGACFFFSPSLLEPMASMYI